MITIQFNVASMKLSNFLLNMMNTLTFYQYGMFYGGFVITQITQIDFGIISVAIKTDHFCIIYIILYII